MGNINRNIAISEKKLLGAEFFYHNI